MNTVLLIYFTGLIITFLFDLSIDLACEGTKFDFKWAIGMLISFTFWPFTILYNIILSTYLHSKRRYTFRVISRTDK